jgi:KDO2-lipid IV(A) lauroyltransferase
VKRATRYAIEDRFAGAAMAVARRLPRPSAMALGRRLGRLWAALDGRHRRIVVDNLRHAFPDWDVERLETTARAVYAHFGSILFDLLWMQGRSGAELMELVSFEGVDHARAAHARGKGVLYCTAHMGNWEIHALAHAPRLGPVHVVARPLDNPNLDARLMALRGTTGNSIVYKRKALASVLGELRAGGNAAMLLDQNVQADDGIFVQFFGRPASHTTVAAALALKTGCALVPAFAELGDDGRYVLRYEPALEVRPDAPREAEIARLTQEIASRTEAWVRRRPEQWLWMHRRWKTQPK